MITPMTKYSFLIYHKEYIPFLEKLQELGVLHIIEKKKDVDENIKFSLQQISAINKALKFLEKRTQEESSEKSEMDGLALVEAINNLSDELSSMEQEQLSLNKEIQKAQPWGDFSTELQDKFVDLHIKIRFFVCSEKKFNPEWKEKYPIEIVNTQNGHSYIVAFQRGANPINIDAEEVKLPEQMLSELLAKDNNNKNRVEEIENTFDEYAIKYQDVLKETRQKLQAKTDFDLALNHTEKQAEEKVMLLEGWIPTEKKDELEKSLDEQNVYYLSAKATVNDNVPIKLKNNKFMKLFEPIGELFALPSYMELDLTPFFAPFFLLFFGFCVGDTGYGILFLVVATIFKFKASKKMKPILSLLQVLGVSTIILGAVSGTVFGINLIDTGYVISEISISSLKALLPADILTNIQPLLGEHFATKDEYVKALTAILGEENFLLYKTDLLKNAISDFNFLNKFRYLLLDANSMFNFALILGVIQIIFGISVRAANKMKQFGFLHGLSSIGWVLAFIVLIVFMGGDSAGLLSLEKYKILFYSLMGLSGVFIIFFNNPSASIFASFGGGLYDIYGTATGVFGDLLSYIRLFALGISSAILGLVFNQIAVQFLEIKYIGWLPFVLLLIFGHGINIFLASLGAFIHPMRLTFVEFYKNAGFVGGGKQYKPFSK
jgi:V/A-type H+/Na+-transporting ATPase subunit I